MVKKLLKYEWSYFIKALMPMELILLGIALLTRFIQFFETDTTAYKIISISSIVAFCIACVVCLVMTAVININRFYRNLYTSEGYLTFTLPVTTEQVIFSKLISAVLTSLLSVVSVIVAVSITTAGEVFAELCKAFGYLVKKAVEFCGWQTLWIFLELLILTVAALATTYLLFYACATLGQTAKKKRVLAAFGFYFVYYFIKQTVGTVFLVTFTAISNTEWFRSLTHWAVNFIAAHPYTSIHIGIWTAIVFTALFGFIYYLISRFVIKKKLNLE